MSDYIHQISKSFKIWITSRFNMGKRYPQALLMGGLTDTGVQKNYLISLVEIQSAYAFWLRNDTPGTEPRDIFAQFHKGTRSRILLTALFITIKGLPTEEWKNKVWRMIIMDNIKQLKAVRNKHAERERNLKV